MKFRILFALVLISSIGVMNSSCVKKPEYPTEPVIVYKDFLRYGNLSAPDSVELAITFTDNEGDVSFEKEDLQGMFKDGNFFMDLYFWDTTGIDHWEADYPFTPQIDTIKFIYRVPPALPSGDLNEPVKGMIYAKQYPFINPFEKIKYVVYLYDKALHKSDTIHTPAIQF